MTSLSTPTRTVSAPLIVAAAVAGALIAGAAALWAYYGPAVFFEMVRAGIAMCF